MTERERVLLKREGYVTALQNRSYMSQEARDAEAAAEFPLPKKTVPREVTYAGDTYAGDTYAGVTYRLTLNGLEAKNTYGKWFNSRVDMHEWTQAGDRRELLKDLLNNPTEEVDDEG